MGEKIIPDRLKINPFGQARRPSSKIAHFTKCFDFFAVKIYLQPARIWHAGCS
jgi:hypothetical protein